MLSCGDDVSTRISSCALPGASDWLNDVRSAIDMSDINVRVTSHKRMKSKVVVRLKGSGKIRLDPGV